MAELPIIENVYRITIEWQGNNGFPSVNTFHARGTEGDTDPGSFLDSVTSTLSAHHDMFNFLISGTLMARVSLTPLDGHTAPVEGVVTGGFGIGTSNAIPAVAQLVHIGTGQRGARGRGRMYIGPITEDATSGGFLDATRAGTVQTAWNDFADDLRDEVDHSLVLGVASYVHADFNDYASITVPHLCATQRRRQDALR